MSEVWNYLLRASVRKLTLLDLNNQENAEKGKKSSSDELKLSKSTSTPVEPDLKLYDCEENNILLVCFNVQAHQ
ncbi:hypothetical protein ABF87_03510 [Nitrosomonas sp. JL21]|nr:hypothetical protein [Nitrosomonas sp. JL21]